MDLYNRTSKLKPCIYDGNIIRNLNSKNKSEKILLIYCMSPFILVFILSPILR